MTFYRKEIERIRRISYSNPDQLKAVIATKNLIDTHFENDLHLDLLSKKVFASKFHLIRLFKRYYGLTPRQYLIDKRVAKSKELLKNGMSVTETCFAVGFESLGSFSTLFKAKTGESPSKFKKEQFSRSR